MRCAGRADVLVILQGPGNKADVVPCERLRFFDRRDGRFPLPGFTDDQPWVGVASRLFTTQQASGEAGNYDPAYPLTRYPGSGKIANY